MDLFEKLLGLKWVEEEDLTETAWWAENVFRGLEQDWPDDQEAKTDVN